MAFCKALLNKDFETAASVVERRLSWPCSPDHPGALGRSGDCHYLAAQAIVRTASSAGSGRNRPRKVIPALGLSDNRLTAPAGRANLVDGRRAR
jgi:hypothetical protein